MSRTPWRLIFRHLRMHWLRTGLTLGALVIALFLFCFLVSIVTSLEAVSKQAATNRVIVQSAVSLFVDLPRDYQQKIASLDGVDQISKFQWFGGIYKDPANFFAQFGVDEDLFFDQYARDVEVIEGLNGETGSEAKAAVLAAMAADRRAAVIGIGLVRRFGFKVGDTIPLIGTIYQRADGGAWDFNVVGIYRPLKQNVDDQTLWFRYDYLEESLDSGDATGPLGVGTYAVNVVPGHDPAAVIAAIDSLFVNGPQKTMTTTEAAFQASFISMFGNIPKFLGTIGGAVVFAVFFSVVNVMLMGARQRIRETGILKALGFNDSVLARLALTESLVVSLLGGGLGVLFAFLIDEPLRQVLAKYIPTFRVEPATLLWGLGIALVIGLVAGLAPAVQMARLRPTEALRSEG